MMVVEEPPPSIYCTSVIPKLPLPLLKKGWAKSSHHMLLGHQLQIYAAKRMTNTKKAAEWANSQAPDDLPFLPDDNLSDEEKEWKTAVIKQMSTISLFCYAIPNWLDYHWGKGDSPATMSKKQAANDSVVSFLSCLAGIDVNSCQRALTVEQLFGKDNLTVSEAFNKHWKEVGGEGKGRTGARTIFVASEFVKLSMEEQKMWKARAAEDAKVVKKSKELTLKAPTLLPPEETQKAMDSLAWILGPLLDGFIMMLGCHASLIVTGLEPQKGGQINILTLHHSYDKSLVPLQFHEAGGERGKECYKMFLAAMGNYIVTCYTKEEQQARALPDTMPPNKPTNFLHWDIPWNVPHGKDGDTVDKAGGKDGASKGGNLSSEAVSGTKKTKKKGKGKKRARTDSDNAENDGPLMKKKDLGHTTKSATSNDTAKESSARGTQSSQQAMLDDITNKVAIREDAIVEGLNGIHITNTISVSPLMAENCARIDPSLLVVGVVLGTLIPNCSPNYMPNLFGLQSEMSGAGTRGPSPPLKDFTPVPQQQKRPKVIQRPCTPEDFDMSEEAHWPNWLKLMRAYLNDFDLGTEWMDAVAALMAVEGQYNF
ncbi:hypothetical protein ARMGADRAFT_1084330 [Armillaria gallica]|uniref:Uncharacterized protein n=1 Tax=Armillaria gallica TaxID=47427 RepID=A0A2H3DBI6_ARMGA|nr:hypothetical protein ARMGADRAFT_1084330 [Armillaria gallica]